jgi:1,5-anhydro-D-fructose reductase (1,5-anhydro-D-mannitol-forming)
MSDPAMADHGRRFRWAVVGIGRHSRLYVIPALAGSRSSELAALVTRDPAGARSFAARWGAPPIYGDYEQALADPEIDGVFLVTPNDLHRRQVLAAAEAGKHVLCEKPLATSVVDAEAMVRACRERGVVLGTGFHLRHNLVHERARELIREGRIGELRFASVRYAHRTAELAGAGEEAIPAVGEWRWNRAAAGGGAFVGTGSHAIDLLRFLTGEELTDVIARADAEEMREMNLVLAGTMSGGCLATVHGGELALPVNEATISGSLGTIVCRGSIGNRGTGTLTLLTPAGEEAFSPPAHDVYVRESEAFVRAVRDGEEAEASGLDGLRCQEVIEAAYASLATSQLAHVECALSTNEQLKE